MTEPNENPLSVQVGLMMAEKIRVELEERQKNHQPPFDKFDY